MGHRREFGRWERFRYAAESVVAATVAVAIVAMVVITGDDVDGKALLLAVLLAFYSASNALILLRPRRPETESRKPSVEQPDSPPWTPPVNEEFERYGEAYFISAAPRFMPRWLVHFNPRSAVADSEAGYVFIGVFRPAYFACASFATWCLRKTWTVSVERRNTAGSGEWRYVVREEFRSLERALDRRADIVADWRDEILNDWRHGDYTPRPFLDAEPPRRSPSRC